MSLSSTEDVNLASAIAAGIPLNALAKADPSAARSLADRLEAALAHKLQIPELSLGATTTPDDPPVDPDDGPAEGFTDINLQAETIRLFRQTRRLLTKVLHDKATPVNQQAAVANSLNGLLKALASQQTDIYNAERLKRFESIVIQMLRTLPEETQTSFIEAYEREVNV